MGVVWIIYTLTILTVSYHTRGDDYKCSSCTCYLVYPHIIMDCRSSDLVELPTLAKSDTYSPSEVYMDHNKIKLLDEKILSTWDLLKYISLTDNPLDCNELDKFGEGVTVVSDCPLNDGGEYTHTK